MIFKLGGNRTFVYFLKFIGLYYSQVLIHVKFICIFYNGACSIFRVFVVLALVAPSFLLWKLRDILGIHHSTHKPVKSVSEPLKGETAAINLTSYYHNKKKNNYKVLARSARRAIILLSGFLLLHLNECLRNAYKRPASPVDFVSYVL